MDRARQMVVWSGVEVRALLAACGLAVCGVSGPLMGQPTAEPEDASEVNTPGEPLVVPARPGPVAAPVAAPGGAGAGGEGRGGEGPGVAAGEAGGDEDLFELSAFTEPVQLSTLVELVATTLNINVTVKGDLQGAVTFNAPVPIRKAELLPFLDAMLEQQNFTIIQDRFGFYLVQPLADIQPRLVGDRATTRIFRTPNIRPSSLRPAIEAMLGGGGGQPGAPGGGSAGRSVAYVDELGVIIATDSARRLDQLEEIIETFREEFARSQFLRVELRYIAAPVARERALQLVGQGSRGGVVDPNQAAAVAGQGVGRTAGALDNIGDRLTVDPQGNALIFSGVPAEIDRVREILAIVDVPTTLVPKQYFAGSAARQLADLARQRGLGEVTTIGLSQTDPNFQIQFNQQLQRAQTGQSSFTGGPVMVVDDQRGTIVYYGTPEQQAQLEQLIKEIDPRSEQTVIGVYKLKHSSAEDVAEVLLGLIEGSTPVGDSPLLPDQGGLGTTGRRPRSMAGRTSANPEDPASAAGSSDEGLSLEGDAFVIADTSNNQILVKAPQAMQEDFRRVIEKLDLRRPQVYVEAKIVAVSWTDEMRLRFESQLINAGGSGGVFQTNFGLSTLGTSGTITQPKVPNPGLPGFTSALILSDYVPIIVNALQTEGDARILSSPQLLVDDNEEAEIISVDQEPTQTTTQTTGNPIQTGFAGYQDAGTTLRITPQISDGGYLRLEYEATLSSFTGQATANLPPPRQENTIRSASVTVPSDMTVVVGGLNFDQRRKTVGKIPLIGDIPIVGLLFQDRNTTNRVTTLYIFLTPRILREPNFADLRLLTRGPRGTTKLPDDTPAIVPSLVDIVMPAVPVSESDSAPGAADGGAP